MGNTTTKTFSPLAEEPQPKRRNRPPKPVQLEPRAPKPISYYLEKLEQILRNAAYDCNQEYKPEEPRCFAHIPDFFERQEFEDHAWFRDFCQLVPPTILGVGPTGRLTLELTGDLIPSAWLENERTGAAQLAEEDEAFRETLNQALEAAHQGDLQCRLNVAHLKFRDYLCRKYQRELQRLGLVARSSRGKTQSSLVFSY